MIRFGLWSTTLLIGSLHGLIVAFLLWRSPRNTLANRFLAGLLLAVVLMITPFTIGYAGFYDAYPWLSFAPFSWQLAFGPLLYCYVRALSGGDLPPRWPWHFLPALLQGGYYTVMFCLPTAVKWAWDDRYHETLIEPLETSAVGISFICYWYLAWRRSRRYQTWLEHTSAAREEFRALWIRHFLAATALVALVYIGYELYGNLLASLSYFDLFPMYVLFTLLVYYLGIEGWRNARLPFPPMPQGIALAPVGATIGHTPVAVATDWTSIAQRWAERVRDGGWWREPDLNVATLAARLGTNDNYLSRALNQGLGQSFSEFINRQRIEEARRLLHGDQTILAIGLEVGFGSKASFNRAFRAYTGATPSEFRAAGGVARRIS